MESTENPLNLPTSPELSKSWYASKTIWANIVAAVATGGVIFGVDLGLSAEVQAEIVAAVLAGVNVVLRLITKQAIG
jgi:hypothetical protein